MTLGADRRQGFTLVELLVVMFISSILMLSVVGVFMQQTRAMALQEDLVDLEQNLRSGMDLLYTDVRMSGAYVKDSMPTFKIGAFTYSYEIGGTPPEIDIALDSNGNPDALSMNYSSDAGLNVTNGTSTSASLKVCNGGNIPIDQLTEGNKLPVSNGGKAQLIAISNVQPAGSCFNVVFAVGQSPVNNSWGIGFDLVPDGILWPNIQSLTYFVDPDVDGKGSSALMIGRNNAQPEIVAFGITDLQVEYGVEVDAGGIPVIQYTTDPAALGAEVADINIVRLTLTGETRNAHSLSGANRKRTTRSMTTEVQVRNHLY